MIPSLALWLSHSPKHCKQLLVCQDQQLLYLLFERIGIVQIERLDSGHGIGHLQRAQFFGALTVNRGTT